MDESINIVFRNGLGNSLGAVNVDVLEREVPGIIRPSSRTLSLFRTHTL